MSGTNKVNLDFQAELKAMLGTSNVGAEHFQDSSPERLREEMQKSAQNPPKEDGVKVDHLKAPGTEIEQAVALDNEVTTEQLFGENVIEGEIPTITQDFTMLQSRKDRLVELGQVANEVYHTKKVSRSQIVAMESFARELVPATPEETENDQRRVLVADNEVNMYTEEPSAVEAENTIENTRTTIDGILGGLKNSTIALGEKIITVAKKDQGCRVKALTEGITAFNASIIKFLENTEQSSLEDAKIKFRTNLNWGNLMAMSIDTACHSQIAGSAGAGAMLYIEKSIEAFDGTSAETLFKNFGDFLATNPIALPVIANFIAGDATVVNNSDETTAILRGTASGSKPLTFGYLFATFGTPRFVEFFNFMTQYIDGEVNAVKAVVEQIQGATNVEGLMEVAGGLQRIHANIMAASANMAVICATQQMINDFLANYK